MFGGGARIKGEDVMTDGMLQQPALVGQAQPLRGGPSHQPDHYLLTTTALAGVAAAGSFAVASIVYSVSAIYGVTPLLLHARRSPRQNSCAT